MKMSLYSLFRHLVLASLTIIVLMPFVWMLSASTKPLDEIFVNELRFLPERWAFAENYHKALTQAPLLKYMLNGLIVTVGIFLCQVAVAVPAAYALAKLRFKGKDIMFSAVLLCLMIPPHAVSIPWYYLMFKLGFLDSYAALIAPFSISVFGIYLMRQFFKTVPDDLVHAARIDGYTEFAIVWRVMLPTAIPALVSFGIFSIVAHWNDYFWPLIVVSSQDYFTPPLGVVAFTNDEAGNDYGPLMAAATLIIAPLIIAYLLAQKRFIEGITMSGMK
ncbi:carbohydrate ABC transporter permease [Photobacterium makurazakiensis]|uniref:carbohydrate ABC transporter permease n=2 Tax=Photobacterium TaxID=657 RepID=UPI003D113EBF